ncbi:MAG: hypothetical protein DRJ03_08580 [Chloroflexi bacterium]|nr:MAG: hypothetical protein DRI81_10220 [Chloroflexota bacterium]RLC86503.1 MAG: hypothetical protein DRJ03_08580 [Chloroflexota bacterium]
MTSYHRASVRELSSTAYELGSGVVGGRLHRSAEDGCWMVAEIKLNEWLTQYDGQEIVLIVSSLEDDRPMPLKVCRTCGDRYRGVECPRCREARIRLRGR